MYSKAAVKWGLSTGNDINFFKNLALIDFNRTVHEIVDYYEKRGEHDGR